MYRDSNLYGWIFTYNHHANLWSAFKREDVEEAFNNFNSDKVLKSASMDALQGILGKYGDKDVETINKMFDNKEGLLYS